MRKYILLANRQKDIEFQYADFLTEDNMRLLLFDFSKKRIGILKVINNLGLKNTKVNYKLFLKNIFNKTIDSQLDYNDKDEYIFIVMARVHEKYGRSLTSYLREKYPSCKLVIYIVDLLHNMRFPLNEAREDFDLICSFDEKECKDNNMNFLLEPFSTKLLSNIHGEKVPEFDVSFVGSSKGRLKEIMWLYSNLTSKGLKCDFYITGVNKKDQIQTDGIHYEWLDFEEVLEHAARSRCIVEIMQKGGYSATTRFAEAVLLNKNLITDCPALEDSNESCILFFDENTDLSMDFVRGEHIIDTNKYVEMLSIESFVRTINEHLDNADL